MTAKTNYLIRRTHRYLGVLLGIQFFMWTIGGLYFSWSNMDEIHGDFQKKAPPQYKADLAFVSPSIALKNLKTTVDIDSILNIALIDILGKPTYRIEYLHGGHHKMYQLADAQTGALRGPLSIDEATALAKQQFNGEPKVISVEEIKDVNGHHEYRTFPNDFKGSSLEFVLSCIAEQKQVFMDPQYFTSKTRFLLLFKNKMCNTAFKIHEIYSFHITQRYIVIRLYGNDTKFCMGVWRKR